MEDEGGSPAMTAVRTRMTGGPEITAAMTRTRRRTSSWKPVPLCEVSVAVEPVGRVSIRNHIRGTVVSVDHGAAMTVVKIDVGRWCPDGGHYGGVGGRP